MNLCESTVPMSSSSSPTNHQYTKRMSGFAGFTEDDIRNLQNGYVPNDNSDSEKHKIKSNLNINTAKRKRIPNRNHKLLKDKLNMLDIPDIPEEAKLSEDNKPPPEIEVILEAPKDLVVENKVENYVNVTCAESLKPTENNSITITNEKKIDLEEFQAKQKLMEEQNRARKELLAKALADRTKRTLEEQQRLHEIQNELKKIDLNLSNDVSILRKEIEMASIEYADAQKRYNKIEKEFLDAKLYLHQKFEKKEMLTEHLCAIIEKNEERKGNKLNELLQKLDVDESEAVQSTEISTSQSS